MPSEYVLQLEERAGKLWGVISQLESKRVVALEKFALDNCIQSQSKAKRYAERIAAAREALDEITKVIDNAS
jgi:hypothetical protein